MAGLRISGSLAMLVLAACAKAPTQGTVSAPSALSKLAAPAAGAELTLWHPRGDCPYPEQCALLGNCWLQAGDSGHCVPHDDADCAQAWNCRDMEWCWKKSPPSQACGLQNDPAPCSKSAGCRHDGRCSPPDGHGAECKPASNADCQASTGCSLSGWCSYDAGSGACRAKSAADCASGPCKTDGQCHPDANGFCAVQTAADCTASDTCTQGHRCSLYTADYGLSCVPASAADCMASAACAYKGECAYQAVEGMPPTCATGPDADCAKLPACAAEGKCALVELKSMGMRQCAPGKPADCANAAVCKTKGLCGYWPYAFECVKP